MTSYKYFSRIFFRWSCSLLIHLSYESKSNSISWLILEYQARMLVLNIVYTLYMHSVDQNNATHNRPNSQLPLEIAVYGLSVWSCMIVSTVKSEIKAAACIFLFVIFSAAYIRERPLNESGFYWAYLYIGACFRSLQHFKTLKFA